jgi:uncharacterized protein
MFESFSDYIAENYSQTRKIVEVGVGHRIDVAIQVKTRLPNAEVVVTDINDSWVRAHRTPKVKAVVDDVSNPKLALYAGAELIYSLHPPVELVQSLVSLANLVGADLLLVPVTDEQEVFQSSQWRRVTKQGRTLGWLLHKKKG